MKITIQILGLFALFLAAACPQFPERRMRLDGGESDATVLPPAQKDARSGRFDDAALSGPAQDAPGNPPQGGAGAGGDPLRDAAGTGGGGGAGGSPVTSGSTGADAAVELTCGSGMQACSNRCVSLSDVKTCGSCTNECIAPMGGTPTCVNQKCVGQCPLTKQLCNGVCIDISRACSGECPSGSHNCSGSCLPNVSVNSCGPTRCEPCKPPANATASCVSDQCQWTCEAGFHACGSECKPNNSVDSCGSRCEICPLGGANTQAVCSSAGACEIQCKSNYGLVCDASSPKACGRARWDFESGTDEGVSLEAGVTIEKLSGSASAFAMRKNFNFTTSTNGNNSAISVGFPFCLASLKDKTFYARVFITAGSVGGPQTCCIGYFGCFTRTNVPVGIWTEISAPLGDFSLNGIGLSCYAPEGTADGTLFSGSIYFDDIHID